MLFKKDGKDFIVHMNKSGYVFVLDKKTGNIENIWPISDLKNFVKDIDRKTGKLVERVELTMNKETLICPSTFGARSWNSGAYNPKTGLWYNDVLDFCGYLKPVEQKVDPKDYGTGHTGSNDFGRLVMAPDGRKPGKLSANDPLTGERKWSVDMDVPGFSCVLTTGGGLGLQRRSDGQAAGARRRHRQGALELQHRLRNARRHRQLRGRWRAVHLGGERLGLLRGDPDARIVAATGKGTGGFNADRLQGFEVVTNWGGSNGPPRFPRAKDVEYRDDSVRNAFPWLDGRTTSRR